VQVYTGYHCCINNSRKLRVVVDRRHRDRYRRRRRRSRTIRYRKGETVGTVVIGRRRIGHRIATQTRTAMGRIRRQGIGQTVTVGIAARQADRLGRILIGRYRLRRRRRCIVDRRNIKGDGGRR
jgi:hypothetical protein